MKDLGGLQSGPSTEPRRSGADSNEPEVTVDLTTELRWFFDGRLPEELLTWFTRDESTGLSEHRCDSYRLDGQVDIGVKRRYKTILELKLRMGAPEPFAIGRDVNGQLERWQRWSPADDRIYLGEQTIWVDVDKTVIKRRFDPDGDELVLTEETRAMTGEGCDAELAIVAVEDRLAWSFAFAAFGPDDGHRAALRTTWSALVRDRALPQRLRLHRSDSCGYPEWMARTIVWPTASNTNTG